MSLIHRTLAALLLSAVCWPRLALADYPSALSNESVQQQLQDDPNRLIPSLEKFSFAVDGQAYARPVGREEFYHGIGYWVQVRSEVRPHPSFSANLRSVLYSGSVSYGYAQPAGLYNLLGLTGVWPEEVAGGKLSLRAMDLGRQTIGVGLLVQDKEMNGAVAQWSRDGHVVTLRADGTGALVIADDLVNLEVSLFERAFGFGGIAWTEGKTVYSTAAGSTSVAEDEKVYRKPYVYLFSGQRFSWFGYDLEFGSRNQETAGLVALSARTELGALAFNAKVEARRYEKGIGEDFAGEIEHDYISYDQYDKSYTDTMNVFARTDAADVYAMHADFHYLLSPVWRLHSLNEVGRFEYKKIEADSYYFFRHGVGYCPIAERDDCLTLFYSNKVMNETFNRPGKDSSTASIPLFKSQPFVGLEASFRF